jgi:hypothetical protein
MVRPKTKAATKGRRKKPLPLDEYLASLPPGTVEAVKAALADDRPIVVTEEDRVCTWPGRFGDYLRSKTPEERAALRMFVQGD